MDNDSPRLRLSILGIVVVSLFGALFARLWYLQVMAAPEYQVEAQANRVRTVAEEAPRGRILDAKGRVLVDNRSSLVVTVNPTELEDVDDPDALLLELAGTLTRFGVPTKVATIERRLQDEQFNPLQPVPVAVDVPEELQLHLAERADDFPAVEVRRESVREYPYGSVAAHLLGYVGRISQTELEDKQGTGDEPREVAKPYQPDSTIGKEGVERTFEDDLRGRPGTRTLEIDANNRPVRTVDYVAPEPGNDIQLAIDVDVQMMAERALAEQLESIRGRRASDGNRMNAPAGSVVVLDPRNGDVLAMASYPTYNPDEFVNGISTDRYRQLTGGAESDNPLIDRSLQGLYAPGSTFKPFTAYAAMSSGVIDGATTFNDRGSFSLGDRNVTNSGGRAHGTVDVARSLTVSSNVFYAWLGSRFWEDRAVYGDGIQQAATTFGFGAPTGVALPAERSGLVPTPDLKAQRHEENPDAFPYGEWFPGDNVNIAIGQGDVLVTPLQLANGYAAIANGGTSYVPNLVTRVLRPLSDPDDPEAVVRVIGPQVRAEVPMTPAVREPIVAGLSGVTASREGTANATFSGFDLAAFPIAGKTGTAEVNGQADNSVFASFAPANDPRYAVAAVLQESGFGGQAAAPTVRRVYELLSGQDITNAEDIRAGAAD
jgi:penicillin-binding protein 2